MEQVPGADPMSGAGKQECRRGPPALRALRTGGRVGVTHVNISTQCLQEGDFSPSLVQKMVNFLSLARPRVSLEVLC